MSKPITITVDEWRAELDRLCGPAKPMVDTLGPLQFTNAMFAASRGLSRRSASELLRGLLAESKVREVGVMRGKTTKVYEVAK